MLYFNLKGRLLNSDHSVYNSSSKKTGYFRIPYTFIQTCHVAIRAPYFLVRKTTRKKSAHRYVRVRINSYAGDICVAPNMPGKNYEIICSARIPWNNIITVNAEQCMYVRLRFGRSTVLFYDITLDRYRKIIIHRRNIEPPIFRWLFNKPSM